MATTPKGPLASANNLTGFTQVAVGLSISVAKTWTHNFNAVPLAVWAFVNGVNVLNNGLAGAAGQVTVSTSTSAITLTPNTLTATVDAIICWALPTAFVNGIQATNFV